MNKYIEYIGTEIEYADETKAFMESLKTDENRQEADRHFRQNKLKLKE